MRFTTTSTWFRIIYLLAAYFVLPAASLLALRRANSLEMSMPLLLVMLFGVFPVITLGLALWDGVVEGFSLLWLVAPFVFFLIPMFIFFNTSALPYGVCYTVCGVAGSALGSCFHGKYLEKRAMFGA